VAAEKPRRYPRATEKQLALGYEALAEESLSWAAETFAAQAEVWLGWED
jgi:hypothetical protein